MRQGTAGSRRSRGEGGALHGGEVLSEGGALDAEGALSEGEELGEASGQCKERSGCKSQTQ